MLTPWKESYDHHRQHIKKQRHYFANKVHWSRLWFFQWSCMDVTVGLWRKLSAEKLMLLHCGVGEDSWESLGLQGDPTSPSWRRSVLGVHWKDWCWNWNSNTLATSCEELTHWKRPWCWEGLGAGGEGGDRGWDGWMASPTRWTWVWVNPGSWWWTGRPGVLRFMGSQSRTRLSDWTGLNWLLLGFPGVSAVKNPPPNAGNAGSIPGSGKSPGGNGSLLQYSCLENLTDRGNSQAIVHEVSRELATWQLNNI